MKAFFELNAELWKNKRTIISMSKKEFKNQYVGSSLGFIWGVLKPLMMAAVYWLVFSFIQSPDPNAPYSTLARLLPALCVWTFMSDSLLQGASSIRDNDYLVKKVSFPVSILPAIRIVVNYYHHLIFLAITLLILLTQNITYNLYFLQLVYYMMCAIIFSIVVTRLFSALVVIAVDVQHFLQTIMQVLLWGTPVLWSFDSVATKLLHHPWLAYLLKANPYAYIVEGYRDALLGRNWFWDQPLYTLYFWGVTLLLGIIGSYFYQKNRKEFADIL